MILTNALQFSLAGLLVMTMILTPTLSLRSELALFATTLSETFPPPLGYNRIYASEASFGHSLRTLRVKPDAYLIHDSRGHVVSTWPPSFRVVDLDLLFEDDLEQCADWAYRLYADYLQAQNLDSLISFRLQNGQTHRWSEWSSGNRLQFDPRLGRHVTVKTTSDSSAGSYNGYLRYLFHWAGSLAMLSYLNPVLANDLPPGDLIVQNTTGAMGHVSLILDICANAKGERLYLIGNGWTPAQEFFVRKPDSGEGSGYWFTLDGYERHLQWFNFGPFRFRRF